MCIKSPSIYYPNIHPFESSLSVGECLGGAGVNVVQGNEIVGHHFVS